MVDAVGFVTTAVANVILFVSIKLCFCRPTAFDESLLGAHTMDKRCNFIHRLSRSNCCNRNKLSKLVFSLLKAMLTGDFISYFANLISYNFRIIWQVVHQCFRFSLNDCIFVLLCISFQTHKLDFDNQIV